MNLSFLFSSSTDIYLVKGCNDKMYAPIKKWGFLILLLVILFFPLSLCAQTSPPIEWQKSLGGISTDQAEAIHQTTDGGFIVAGTSNSNNGDVSGNHGYNDYWIVKLDTSGSIEWQRCLGGTGEDYANSIQQITDGGYIVAGTSSSNDGDVSGNHGDYDYWIVKLDATGNIEWEKSLGGGSNDIASSIQQTTDGGFIVAGYSLSNDGDVSGNHGDSDYWIVKLEANGNIVWQKSLGGSKFDDATSVRQTAEGGFIVAGDAYSHNGDVIGNHGQSDFWIVKLDVSGNVEWKKCLGGLKDDNANAIEQTTDRGYIVAGYTISFSGNSLADYCIIKLDSLGSSQWQKYLGGTYWDNAFSISQTSDSGYIVTGETGSANGDVSENHGGYDAWTVKVNASGSIEWEKSLGGSYHDHGMAALQIADERFVVACNSGSSDGDVSGNHGSDDYWIVKLFSCSDSIFFYADADGDGYGNAGVNLLALACSPPAGYVYDTTDCNDNNAAVNPAAVETCDSIDDNCNGSTDEGLLVNFYADMDGDSFGDSDSSLMACFAPNGYVSNHLDCDDNNAAVYPNNPLIQDQKSLGGSFDEAPNCIRQTTDKGFIIAGWTESVNGDVSVNQGADDYWIVKLDSSQNLEWEKDLGGHSDEHATSTQQTSDGGFIIAGSSSSQDGDVSGNHGGDDEWILKLDESGNILWKKCFGGSLEDRAYSILQTADGGYIAAGSSNSNNGDVSGNHGSGDFWIIKLDANGNLIWQKSLGGIWYETANSIEQTIDGGFIVGGWTDSDNYDVSGNHGSRDGWIVKLDVSGNIEWQKCLGGTSYDEAKSIHQTTDGGFIVAVSSNSSDGDVSGNHGHYDYWIVKLDPTGNIIWQKCLGGSQDDYISDIKQTIDGGFVIAGASLSEDGDVTVNHGHEDYWIVQLDNSGDILWQETLGGALTDVANSIVQITGTKFMIAGSAASIGGDVSGNHGGADYWIVKTPGITELCNNVDDNCNGSVDEGLEFITYYADADGDNYGDNSNSVSACEPVTGFITAGNDCNDSDPNINPGAPEIPNNGVDDNCNGDGDEFGVGIYSTDNDDAVFSVFPNPTSGVFTIFLRLDKNLNVQTTIQVLNLMGQIIYEQKVQMVKGVLKHEIQLSNEAEGIYSVKVMEKDRVYKAQIHLQK